MSDELIRAAKKAITQTVYNDGRRAVLGRADGTIYFTDEGGTEHLNTVWIRYADTDGPAGEAHVYGPNIPPIFGLPLRIQNRNGVLTAVIEKYGGVANSFSNDGTTYPAELHDHYRLGPNPNFVEGLRFLPLAVVPSTPLALTVYVFPGWYRYQGPQPVAWSGGNTGSLSAYVPSVDDGSKHFIIIAIDRSDNTLAIIDGADLTAGGDPLFPTNPTVTISDIEAIAIAEPYLPLGVVLLEYGHTTIKPKDIVFDYHLWNGSAMDIIGLTAVTAPDPAADYAVIYDTAAAANRKVLLENMPGVSGASAMLFNQTVDKTVADSTAETGILSAGRGVKLLPADLLQVGSVIRLSLTGYVSTTGTPDLTVRVKLSGVELASTGANALGSSITDVGWRMWVDIVCRVDGASGEVVTNGLVRLGADLFGLVKTTATTIDTTVSQWVEVTAEWGTQSASNTFTCQTAVIEHLAPIGLAPVGPSDLTAVETV
jgi:hypothetical protein